MTRMITKIFLVLTICALIFVCGCKTKEEAKNADQQAAEQATAFTASNVSKVTKSASTTGASMTGAGSSGGATYNANTGWWTVNRILDTGESVTYQIQFKNGANQVQKYFKLTSTAKILVKGTGTDQNGSFTFDYVITGVGLTSNQWTINGTGSYTYQGKTTQYEIKNLTSTKLEDGIPDGGKLIVTSSGITLTLEFNGTTKVNVTYSYEGNTYTFTVDLLTGAIS